MWKNFFNFFGGGNNLLNNDYVDMSNENDSYITTTTSDITSNIPTTVTYMPVTNTSNTSNTPYTVVDTWQVQSPQYPVTITVPSINQNVNVTLKPDLKIILSSEKAYFLSEDEIIGLLNPCKAMVEVLQKYNATMMFSGSDSQITLMTLEEFLEQFRPEIFEKYKLLMEKQ